MQTHLRLASSRLIYKQYVDHGHDMTLGCLALAHTDIDTDA